jgi:sulfur-oxidizing protein SoxA
MKRIIVAALALLTVPFAAEAGPKEDLKEYREYFARKFPGVPLDEFANGVYAIDASARSNWEAIEEFPPYEAAIDDGKKAFEKKFANGKGYADCFPKKGIGIADQYPMWDKKQGKVVTLALALNQCREANGEKPLKYKKGEIANVLAYMAYTSRGNKTNVVVPNDPGAQKAYEDGKEFYFARRGQLNFACSTCHFDNSGQMIRSERLSMAVGQTSHWPVYRSKWNEMGTLHRRFTGCNEQVRAKAFEAQGDEYRNLEYFLTHMSNGVPLNGPGARK